MFNMRLPLVAAVSAVALVSACQKTETTANDEATANAMIDDNSAAMSNDMASAGVPTSFNISSADGKPMGSVTLSEDPAGMMINVSATGMPPGVHGLHLHEKGLCEGPDFKSAGAHWNPQSKQHGKDNPMGAHLGDLPNLAVAADGSATVSIPGNVVTMASLADADGTSLVVHAKADDYKPDPSGDSGDRIACAVIAPPMGG
jgi:Cu-Zn family superoxide dismutase